MGDEEQFLQEYHRTLAAIDNCPPEKREALKKLAKETYDSHIEMKEAFEELHNSCKELSGITDDLRIDFQYFALDLEATKRENEVLKQRIRDLEKDLEES